MKKIKVGYLPLYIKLYDDSNPHYRDPMVDYMHMLIKMLESQGLEVVLADEVCRIKPEFDRAAKKFNDAGVSAVITQHLAYSPSLESIEALLSLDAPIIVFDTTPDYQLLKVANYKGCISANHGIHGVQDMCNLLKRNGKPYYLCVGHALHSEVVSEVVGMCRAAAVKKAFQTEKVGSVGGSFTGMGDFLVSDERYKNDIGVEVQYMTTEVVKEYLPKVTEEEIDAELAYDAAHYDSDITFQAEYREATRSGLAVRKWMQDNGLHAATVNFLTLDICGLPKMPFIECCKIMERGQGYAGEGDVLTAALVGSLLRSWDDTTFVEMFCPNWHDGYVFLSHMGEYNLRIAGKRPRMIVRPFPFADTGDPYAIMAPMRAGRAAIVNLAPLGNGKYALTAINGEMLPVSDESKFTNVVNGWFRPDCGLPAMLEKYSGRGGTHHSAMVYGADASCFAPIAEKFGWSFAAI